MTTRFHSLRPTLIIPSTELQRRVSTRRSPHRFDQNSRFRVLLLLSQLKAAVIRLASTMAVKDEFTLADFTRYARENFPGAFEIVADPSLYKFEANRVCTANSGVKEVALLHIAYWNGQHHGIPVWASLDRSNVQYSYNSSKCVRPTCATPAYSEDNGAYQTFRVPSTMQHRFCTLLQHHESHRKRLTSPRDGAFGGKHQAERPNVRDREKGSALGPTEKPDSGYPGKRRCVKDCTECSLSTLAQLSLNICGVGLLHVRSMNSRTAR
ncbi:uncharacterized protein EKO05_0009330 [Ascochyta rabiei]|uniref:uncharacterized protein n=1 Tax=Didymella rabiei TaxID=5454 RepID=UPI00220EFEDC|nr:uncharacterized protein EKO05_0009330 [Ascochyta rabiei]UPX19054.1 hypothetical protein EKO05_0009330 [Ascochyta rabiei]